MKTKALISFAVTAKLTCFFVFAYAKSRFSHNKAHIKFVYIDVADCDSVHEVKPVIGLCKQLKASGNLV